MIEQLLKAYAEAGKFVHLSVYAQWGAHNSPTVFHASFITPYGQGHGDNVDPVAAIIEAVDKAPKFPQRRTPVIQDPRRDKAKTVAPQMPVSLAPAPVRGQPVAPAKAKDNNRKTPQGRDLTTTPLEKVAPNLMELFK